MRKYTPEERWDKYRARYLALKAKRLAAGVTSNGRPWVPRVELTFDQALQEAKERFWSHVRKEADGCWYWTAGVNRFGYGKFKVHGKTVAAHRIAYLLERGSIPLGKLVCHECDHSGCVNPDHLWVGTEGDNMDDKVKKGRQAKGAAHAAVCKPPRLKGEQCAHSKLSTDQVVWLRKLRAEGRSLADLATQFGVCKQTVHDITTGKSWSHVPAHKEAQ